VPTELGQSGVGTAVSLIFMPTWYQNLQTKTCSLLLLAFTPGLTPGVLSPTFDRLSIELLGSHKINAHLYK